jgi:hypothetical protein
MNIFWYGLGLLFLAVALYELLTGRNLLPRPVWYAANVLLVFSTLQGGYASMEPERLLHTNPDWTFCAAILLTMPLFSIGSVYYSIHRRNNKKIPRPSWNRNPLNWWDDPLQSLFISTWSASGVAAGGVLHSVIYRPVIGTVAFWTLGANICFVLGLFIGQILVYRIYRQNIIAPIH